MELAAVADVIMGVWRGQNSHVGDNLRGLEVVYGITFYVNLNVELQRDGEHQ